MSSAPGVPRGPTRLGRRCPTSGPKGPPGPFGEYDRPGAYEPDQSEPHDQMVGGRHPASPVMDAHEEVVPRVVQRMCLVRIQECAHVVMEGQSDCERYEHPLTAWNRTRKPRMIPELRCHFLSVSSLTPHLMLNSSHARARGGRAPHKQVSLARRSSALFCVTR
jgi:hypothetical protein